ncbi:5-methylcytosine-specific restriction enzyme A OS=Bosea thiooxidans OX=53254 GN=SAMN05660750_04314 PE=4 SV=1 [Bosea thiooxidans]|uniref:5-methylcytosine-specific restriction enzyme A n=1 Tax=Bosea thiooxidans TaxID=53254 RepID=A0A1T5GQW0_9HYPH|nr:HNH endonuclease [Bosea thiooxidans]SKC10771.1 5-methylcytosine-specific restriction enzyme A [Bosea thiooxidans]
MSPDPRSLAERISAETGLEFSGREGRDSGGTRWLELQPAGYPSGQTFTLRTFIGWRRLDVHFRPGNFAGDLMNAMGSADETGRRTFRAVLDVCRDADAEITLSINGATYLPDDSAIWEMQWRSFGIDLRRGMLAINEGNAEEDMRQVELWTSRVAAAVLALLPVETEEDGSGASPEIVGLPEGARTRIEVNGYERDRRNRAAALAIHGYSCKACKLDMEERYGAAAAGLIEVHHVTPVSQIGKDYIIDPRTDLTPLCPNCHSVAHRRNPPYSVDDLREMVASAHDT